MRYGIARGVFTNEAGMGSSTIVHATASCKDPAVQGMWGMVEVFIDTMVVCTITGLALLSSGVLTYSPLDGCALTAEAFSLFIPWGGKLVLLSVVLFALCSIVGWAYYGEQSAQYLFRSPRAVQIYRCIFSLCVVVGALMKSSLVWELSDALNGLMSLPNMIALLLLSPLVVKKTQGLYPFLCRRKQTSTPKSAAFQPTAKLRNR